MGGGGDILRKQAHKSFFLLEAYEPSDSCQAFHKAYICVYIYIYIYIYPHILKSTLETESVMGRFNSI